MRLDQKIAALAAQQMFSIFEPAALHVLGFSAQTRSLRAGEELFRKGDVADGGFLVVSGRISVSSDEASLSAGEQIGPGGLIGVAALVSEGERPAMAIALEPSELLVLPRSLMRLVLEAHPVSAAALRRHIAAIAAETHRKLAGLI